MVEARAYSPDGRCDLVGQAYERVRQELGDQLRELELMVGIDRRPEQAHRYCLDAVQPV